MGALSATTGSFTTITGTSFNSITGLASVAPSMDGTAAVGTSTLTARQDHVHPVDTSRQAQLNGTGFVKVSGTTVSYDNSTYLTGTKVDSFNTRTGAVTLTSSDVTTALTYTPINKAGDTGIGNLSMGALSATTGTFSGALTANNGMNVNRSNSASTGILYYSSGYTAWQTYMSNAGAASGVSGTVVAPTGTYVTTWGLRSFVENTAGYGWTWESGTATSTTPSIVAELSSNTGNFRTIGSISATTGTFSGALTATSETISGNGIIQSYGGTGGISGTIKFADTQISGQTPGLAYLQWDRGSSQDRNFRVFTCDSGGNSHQAMLLDANANATFNSVTATTGAFSGSVSQTPVAFASLPAGSAGMRAFVNNNSAGAAFGSAANGSGSTTYPVYHDGASWKIG
jgi:hypothetical protein